MNDAQISEIRVDAAIVRDRTFQSGRSDMRSVAESDLVPFFDALERAILDIRRDERRARRSTRERAGRMTRTNALRRRPRR